MRRNMVKKAKKNNKKEFSKGKKVEYTVSSGNIYADFGYPNAEEANAKWDLAYLIKAFIKKRKLSQKEAADLMEIDQPKVSKIVRGILSEFTLDRLMKFLVALGYDIEIKPALRKTRPSIHVSGFPQRRAIA